MKGSPQEKEIFNEKFPNELTVRKTRKRKEQVVQRFALQFLGIRGWRR